MPNFNTVFKAEVTRLARKEARGLVGATRKATTQHRRDIAALKKEIAALNKKVASLERGEKKRLTAEPAAVVATNVRFSPKRLKAHRARLGLSAADYGLLVGVTGQTIYNWESGKGKPRGEKIAAWATIRDLGVRDADQRLQLLYDE